MTSQFKTFLLLSLLSALVILIGGMLGGRTGIIIALILAIALNVGNYWFSDQIVLSMYNANPVNYDDAPYIYQIVEELANRAHIPAPKIYIVPEETPNAFAVGRDPEHSAIALTDGIMRLVTPEQLRGVIAHEMAHIINRDTLIQTIAAVMASTIVTIASIFKFTAIFGGSNDDNSSSNPIFGLILAFLAPVAASLIQMAISRSREFLADATGASLCRDPNALAGALTTIGQLSAQIPLNNGNPSTSQLFIVQPNFDLGATIERLFSTHPPLQERIERLHNMSRQF